MTERTTALSRVGRVSERRGTDPQVDVCVVGAGQAGLAAGFYLQRADRERRRRGAGELSWVVPDAHDRPGGSWPETWPSLRLFSPAAYSSLPGWPMPRWSGEDNPPASHVVAYLRDYEQRYGLDVRRPVRVHEVRRDAGERLRVRTDHGDWSARAIISATGTQSRPFVPAVPGADDFEGTQVHTAGYRGPAAYAGQRVLVVGGANSAAQVAADLLPVAERLHWAALRPPRYLPDHVDGRVLFETATQAVRDRAAGRPARGVASLGDVVAVPPVREARDRGGLRAVPMVERLTRTGARWPDGREEPLDAVVWATGFRPALGHLRALGLAAADGRLLTEAPAGGTMPVQAAGEPRVLLLGYGDWCGPASATLVGVGRPAREAVAAVEALVDRADRFDGATGSGED